MAHDGISGEIKAMIERRLLEPLTLADIAAASGFSPFHLSRLFTVTEGEGVIAFVRRRRLELAADRLRREPALRLIDLAFDTLFESQEAFTRAFKRFYGVAPGRFRQGRAPLHGAYAMTDIDLPTPSLAYQGLRRRGEFRVAGFKARFTADTRAEIPRLWDRLVPRLPLPGQTSFATYGLGLCVRGEGEEASFDYMAGAEVPADAPAPEGMSAEEVPGQTYAVFRQTLELGPLHPQMRAATEEIWGRRLKAGGLEPSGGPDFEFYPDDFNPTKAGAIVEYWIPVKA